MQHLRIKVFFGTSENAVKTQIWIAISTYLLIVIAKKRLHLDRHSLYEILHILSLSMFETIPINQLHHPQQIQMRISSPISSLSSEERWDTTDAKYGLSPHEISAYCYEKRSKLPLKIACAVTERRGDSAFAVA